MRDNSEETGESRRAEKQRVKLTMRVARAGAVWTLAAAGRLHRLPTGTGWVLTCKLAEHAMEQAGDTDGAGPIADRITDAAIDSSSGSSLTLIMRPDEIRMKRTGHISQEQRFRIGHWLAGTIGTAYGDLRAEALTHHIEMDLTSDGGAVEWEYDLRTAEQELGRTAVTLLIQEDPSV